MRRSLSLAFVMMLFFAAGSVFAADKGVGLRAGTQGIGAEGAFGLTDWITIRGGIYNSDVSADIDEGGINYDGDLQLGGYGLMADVFPLRGSFRITGGLFSNRNAVEIEASPTQDVVIGGVVYTPAEVGTLNGDVDFDSTAPYVGIGWGNLAKGRRLGFVADLGVLAQGAGEVTLSSTSALINAVDLAAEELEIEDEIKDYDLWPVMSVGLAVRF